MPWTWSIQMQDSPVTCGVLYERALGEIAGFLNSSKSTYSANLYGAGFATGQAEKVYLGACKAAMFRPSKMTYDDHVGVCRILAGIYGLDMRLFDHEVWLVNPDFAREWVVMVRLPMDSPEFHTARGLLCGIPARDIDGEFHLREGYKQQVRDIP